MQVLVADDALPGSGGVKSFILLNFPAPLLPGVLALSSFSTLRLEL